jgi:hypothetical protein
MTEEIKDPEEITNVDPPEETVGEIMQKANGEGVKFWLVIGSALIYVAGIVYAEVHGLTLLSNGVAPDMLIWARMGMIAAGLSAVLLPLTLLYWTMEAKQRLFTFAFYALDFAFLAFNAFTDFNTNTGQTLAPWAQSYVTYILPASPIMIAAFWAVVWELDPIVKQKVLTLTLRAAMREKMARKVADAAKGSNVTAVVNAAAQREVDRALTELFGAPVSGYVMNAADLPQSKGMLQSFFGYLSKLAQQVLLSATPSQSNPSPSDNEKPQP